MKKTLSVAAIAALAVPGATAAHGKSGEHGKSSQAKSHHAKSHHAKGPKGKAFTIKGVDAANLTVTNGELAGPLTLDPTSANKHARKFLDLTKTELKGEDTVTFGEAGDDVKIRYVGLAATDELKPTDKVKVIGKVQRDGKLNIRKIQVTRKSETEQAEAQKTEAEKTEAEKTESKTRS